MQYGALRTHYFSSNSKILQIGPTWAISDYRKKPKRVVLIIGHRKHDSGIRTEAFKPMWLYLGTVINEKRDRGLFVAILRICHITFNNRNF